MITSSCEFFKRAIDGGFQESHENQITLEETTAFAVAIVILHLYTGSADLQFLTSTIQDVFAEDFDAEDSKHGDTVEGLLEVYLLADRIMLEDLQQKVDKRVGSLLETVRKEMFKEVASTEIFDKYIGCVQNIYEQLPDTDCLTRTNLTTFLVTDPGMDHNTWDKDDKYDTRKFERLLVLATEQDPVGVTVGKSLIRLLRQGNINLEINENEQTVYALDQVWPS